MAYLKHQREEYKEAWASSTFDHETYQQTYHDNIVAQAKCLCYEEIMSLKAEDIEPSLLNQSMGEEE